MKEIVTKNFEFNFSEEEYEELKQYIVKERRNSYLADVIGNCNELTGFSEKHLTEYLNSPEIREEAGTDYEDILAGYISGEDEYYALVELVNSYNIRRYRLISNKDTVEQVSQEVIMTPADIEKLEEVMREKEDCSKELLDLAEDSIDIYDVENNSICYFYVDEYEEIGDAI